ncbi:type VII secretion protein EccB [Asanoa ishikariensis]|uniref:Type VII secretion protein EccB n=1 Tax=Asanoa ishikariensis TaxID=137265 RepID=A0A1H3KTN9_9ACTN|nr:type VII secretion protein EccB [Asanoa ishikariensis]GIF69719.1 type VII secretion protein EccB [Asanoa ishikariensis]SDY55118.1 type VII secretion protein EccB [Asanoa ishikariensis]
MRSRQEQVQAHRFITRRIVSGLLSGEPETTELPMRRFGLAMFGSVMVAAIVFAIIGVIGLVNPGGGKPATGELIIMRETGARYVLVDDTLHPVLNWTSALLFAGTEKPAMRQMSRDSLSAYAVGEPIGIPGAPDPPPDRGALLKFPWSVCSTSPQGAGAPTTTVFVGREPAGGAALGADSALLLSTPADDSGPVATYLVLGDRRYRVVDETTLTALELAAVTPVIAGKALLNGISSGPELRQPRIEDAGETSPREVGGDRGEIGQVYRAGAQRYVLTRDGLVTIGEVSAKLLLANDPEVIEISAAEAANALVRGVTVEPKGFPATLPAIPAARAADPMLCAVHNGATAQVRRYATAVVGGVAAAGPGRDGVGTADRVVVASGKGALVRAEPAPGVSADTTTYLVTDQGYKYPLRTDGQVNAAVALGYSGVDPLPVPTTLLALLPNGPMLDPTAAQNFVRPAG